MERWHLSSWEKNDGQLTAKTLWVAQSHTGDYHDNMNSEMLMLWVKRKLVVLFETLYPCKKMVLIANSALYHHKREIESLSLLSKKALVLLMQKHKVEYIDLPITTDSRNYLLDLEKNPDHPDVQNRGDVVRIYFLIEEQIERADIVMSD